MASFSARNLESPLKQVKARRRKVSWFIDNYINENID